ncbi:ABC transporter permease [bacterium]|nr:ABC transporter permease [bacterium]
MVGISEVGSVAQFGFRSFAQFFRHGTSRRHLIEQVFATGVRSVSTTLTAGIFVGAIMALQIHEQLRDFGAESYLGGLSTSVTVRNVGPVLIAFLLAAKVGAYTSAELAAMQVTDQINALKCLGVDPIRYLVVPRMIAVVVSSFLLLILGLMTTVLGGVLFSAWNLGVNPITFLSNIPALVTYWSLGVGVMKSLVFGILLSVICCYHGYFARGGSEGVGQTVQKTAVWSMVAIVVANYLVSSFGNAVQALLGGG